MNEVELELLKDNVGYVCAEFNEDDQFVSIKNEQINGNTPFRFDKVFNINATQEAVFDYIGKETVIDVTSGYNGTIFTYGQSGSGKTFTMYGNDIYDELGRGIIPRIISNIFEIINSSEEHFVFQLKLSVLQIYKEVIYDLLTGEKDLKIKENPIRGIYVDGLSEVFVDSIENFMGHVKYSQEQRIVSGTKLNQYSSRSHSILILEVK